MNFGLSTYLPAVAYLTTIAVFWVMIVKRRDVGLYFIVALLPAQIIIEKMHRFPLGKDIVDIFVITLLWFGIIERNKIQGQHLEVSFPGKAIGLYVLLTYIYLWVGSGMLGLSLPIGVDPRFVAWKNHMILPALFFITVKLIRRKQQMIALCCSMLVSMLLLGVHFYRNFSHTGGNFQEDRRWSGAFSYLGPNEIGAFWAEYSFIILGLLLLCNLKIWKYPLLAVLSLNVYGLVYSFSRGAYLAFLVGIIFMSLAVRNVKLLVAVALFLIFWGAIVPESVVQRIEMSQTEGELDSSGQGRMGRWTHGVNLFLKNPLGYGYETVGFLGFRGFGNALSSGGDPHNRYIEFLVEMGVVGLVLFLYLFYLAFKNAYRLYLDAEDKFLKGLGLGFAGTVVACIVANLFGDRWTYVMLGSFYWVLWGLVVRGNMMVQTEKHGSRVPGLLEKSSSRLA